MNRIFNALWPTPSDSKFTAQLIGNRHGFPNTDLQRFCHVATEKICIAGQTQLGKIFIAKSTFSQVDKTAISTRIVVIKNPLVFEIVESSRTSSRSALPGRGELPCNLKARAEFGNGFFNKYILCNKNGWSADRPGRLALVVSGVFHFSWRLSVTYPLGWLWHALSLIRVVYRQNAALVYFWDEGRLQGTLLSPGLRARMASELPLVVFSSISAATTCKVSTSSRIGSTVCLPHTTPCQQVRAMEIPQSNPNHSRERG